MHRLGRKRFTGEIEIAAFDFFFKICCLRRVDVGDGHEVCRWTSLHCSFIHWIWWLCCLIHPQNRSTSSDTRLSSRSKEPCVQECLAGSGVPRGPQFSPHSMPIWNHMKSKKSNDPGSSPKKWDPIQGFSTTIICNSFNSDSLDLYCCGWVPWWKYKTVNTWSECPKVPSTGTSAWKWYWNPISHIKCCSLRSPGSPVGGTSQATMFLLSDTQIINETFLEDSTGSPSGSWYHRFAQFPLERRVIFHWWTKIRDLWWDSGVR